MSKTELAPMFGDTGGMAADECHFTHGAPRSLAHGTGKSLPKVV